ncbi:MAG: LTA synthase family protein [Anaerobacillus sp.]|uniref:LTA synthase family protein n=1 Tax=Anaerobacillus sp. TaxID=1872506 RepID=UPI00391D3494
MKTKFINLLLFLTISLLFMEILFRLSTTGKVFSWGLLTTLIFSISLAIVYFIICCLLQRKASHLFAAFFLFIAAVIFATQHVYYDTFKTFYSIYSAGNSTQLLEFRRDFWYLFTKNIGWLLPFFLPVVLMLVYGKKYLSFGKIKFRYLGWLVLSFLLFHSSAIGLIHLGGKGQHSAYDLYYKNRNVVISSDRIGLFTTMRIDLQRQVFGWSPTIEALEVIAPQISEPPPQNENEPSDDDKKQEETIIEYNMINIDFEQLITAEDDQEIKDMHHYFSNVIPTDKNEFTGKFAGYNLILITAESYAPYAVHEEVTPTLHKLVNEGYRFTNFYTPLWEVSTTDGEYVALTSLLPKSGVWSFKESGANHLPFVIGNQFKNLGYKTVAYHNHTYTFYNRDVTHANIGYQYKAIGNGLDVKQVWPASDLEMMQVSVPEYINDQPFHAYYMTVSGHLQYNFEGNSMAMKNKQFVDHLPYSVQAKAYIATHVELDKALEHLLNELEEAGVADNTLIAISSDHYPYGLDENTIEELSGKAVNNQFDLYKNEFIIYTKGMEPMKIDRLGSSLDILPTLSNLLGLDYDSRFLMGRDIFSDTEAIVPFLDRSFITDKGKYNALTKEYIPTSGFDMDQEYIDKISSEVERKFYYSAKILENDYFRKVYK